MNIQYDANGLPLPDGLPARLDMEQAVQFFGLEKKTLQRWASQRIGPPVFKLHRRLWYPTAPGAEWLRQQARWKIQP